MDSKDEVSKIYEKSEYTWVIDDFFKLMGEYKTGTYKESPVFPGTSDGRKYLWKLRFYPNGEDEDDTRLSFSLHPASCFECFVEFSFILKNSNDDIIVKEEDEYSFEKDEDLCYFPSLTISEEDVKTSLHNVMKINVVIRAEILVLQSYHIPHIQENKNSPLKLSRELKTMFNSDRFSDFLFKFEDDSTIKVHRCILAARSQVFSAMFEHDTLEKSSGFAKIIDIDKETMVALLNFIYTGIAGELPLAEAKKLTYAANKYQLDDLKHHCGSILVDNLKFSNAVEILQLVDRYDLLELKNKTLEYIIKSENFPDPSDLRPLETSNPHLITELFMKLKFQ